MMTAMLAARQVPRVGLGCMGMSEFYGDRNDDASLAALARAYEVGYRHVDTADMYGSGHNEELIGRFLRAHGRRSELFIASKVGIIREAAAKFSISVNGRPEYVREACEQSLRRLGVDCLDTYYLHRQDPKTPLVETIGAMGRLVEEGKVRGLGICEVSAATLRSAHREHPIAAVQSEYSLWSRQAEDEILPACEELGIAFVAFSPLGRGFLTGTITREKALSFDAGSDLRAHLPRFQEQNLQTNLTLLEELRIRAAALGVSMASVALAWVLGARGNVHVIPGSTRGAHLTENFAAGSAVLPPAMRKGLDEAFTGAAVAGARYPVQLAK